MYLEVDTVETEDIEKLKQAVHNLFPDAVLKKKKGKLVSETRGSVFEEAIKKQKIEKTISNLFLKNEGFVDLSKNAALARQVSVDLDNPIGKIRLYQASRKS